MDGRWSGAAGWRTEEVRRLQASAVSGGGSAWRPEVGAAGRVQDPGSSSLNLTSGDSSFGSEVSFERRCTDVAYAFLFLFTVALASGLAWNYCSYGDIQTLATLPDLDGRPCNLGKNAGKPFLYFCPKPGGKMLNLNSAICVESCPNSTKVQLPCFPNGLYMGAKTPPRLTPAYPSTPSFTVYCVPKEPELEMQLNGWFETHKQFEINVQVSTFFQRRTWLTIGVSVAIALCLCYIILFLLKYCASCLIFMSVATSFLFLCAFEALISYHWWIHRETYMLAASICCFLAICRLALQICRQARNLDVAGNSINAACEAFYDIPALRLQVFPVVVARFVLYGIMTIVVGLALMKQQGEYMRVPVDSWMLVAVALFAVAWMLELLRCLSTCVTAWCVHCWYFDGAEAAAGLQPLALEFWLLRYHFGSLALGSLVVMLFRPIRWLMAPLQQAAAMDTNPCMVLLSSACCCCAWLNYELQPYNRFSLLTTAVDGSAYFESARMTHILLTGKAMTNTLMTGAISFFQMIGFAFIFSMNTFIVWLILKIAMNVQLMQAYGFDYSDEGKAVAGQSFIFATFCGVIGILVGEPFMSVFGSAAQTLLYCMALEEEEEQFQAEQTRAASMTQQYSDDAPTPFLLRAIGNVGNYVCAQERKPLKPAPAPFAVEDSYKPRVRGVNEPGRRIRAALPLAFDDPMARVDADFSRMPATMKLKNTSKAIEGENAYWLNELAEPITYDVPD